MATFAAVIGLAAIALMPAFHSFYNMNNYKKY